MQYDSSLGAGTLPAVKRLNHDDLGTQRRERDRQNMLAGLFTAFHLACDHRDFKVAQELIHTVEESLVGHVAISTQAKRRLLATLVAAHERLWQLRNQAN